MPSPLDPAEVLNREFLGLRARLLEMAAALDRLDRAAAVAAESDANSSDEQNGAHRAANGQQRPAGSAASTSADTKLSDDARLAAVRQALAVLAAPGPDRAERIQRIFSDEYFGDWREKFSLPAAK